MLKVSPATCFFLLGLMCMSCAEPANDKNKVDKAAAPPPGTDSIQSTRPAVTNEAIAILEGKIAGDWVSAEDSLWKLTFKQNYTCNQYYGGAFIETDSFKISGTSPQCGIEVSIDPDIQYLELADIKTGDKICYEINGITDSNLSLRVIDRGGALVFRKE